jgi:hypothetical protein
MMRRMTRKEIEITLRDIVKWTNALKPVNTVRVFSMNDINQKTAASIDIFKGGELKDELFNFLMGKSITSTVGYIRTKLNYYTDLELVVVLLESTDGRPLKRTNIDARMMRLIERVRYAK